MFFNSNIKYLRKEDGLTQEETAKLIGISRPAYASYEEWRAQPSYEVLIKISQVFEVGLHALLCEDLSKSGAA